MASVPPLMAPSLLLSLLLISSYVAGAAAAGKGRARSRRGGRNSQSQDWQSANATFYGHSDGSETTAGACGYVDTVKKGYGLQTAALSMALFGKGSICGACFEIKCVPDGEAERWCNVGGPSIVVTATNSCPPNYALPSDNGGWCNPPRVHFDLTMPAFLQIAQYEAGIVPISYRRVPCRKEGGIRFTMNGNQYANLILVWNVGGAGDVCEVMVKGEQQLGWTTLKRNWGQNWETGVDLTGQTLSFTVGTGDKRTLILPDVVPRDWKFGQTYEGKNFS